MVVVTNWLKSWMYMHNTHVYLHFCWTTFNKETNFLILCPNIKNIHTFSLLFLILARCLYQLLFFMEQKYNSTCFHIFHLFFQLSLKSLSGLYWNNCFCSGTTCLMKWCCNNNSFFTLIIMITLLLLFLYYDTKKMKLCYYKTTAVAKIFKRLSIKCF